MKDLHSIENHSIENQEAIEFAKEIPRPAGENAGVGMTSFEMKAELTRCRLIGGGSVWRR